MLNRKCLIIEITYYVVDLYHRKYVEKLLHCYKTKRIIWLYLQDNYNVLHIAAMYSREDVIKSLLVKKGVDPFSTGGVSIINQSV